MGSASAQLDGGPACLSWHKANGIAPHQNTAAIVMILDRRRGRDCPDHLWEPNKRYVSQMKKAWLSFLELRTTIGQQVTSLSGGLSKNPAGIQFIDLHGKIVEWNEAAADYLRYLPPPLVPEQATAFLPRKEVTRCLEQFRAMAERVASYIPEYQEGLDRTGAKLAQEADAMNALDKYRNLSGRFGDFTIQHRATMTGLTVEALAQYDMRGDILKRVMELTTLRRKVGPFERALTLFWYQEGVPEHLRSRLDGNVERFLRDYQSSVGEDDARQGFELIHRLTAEHGVIIIKPKSPPETRAHLLPLWEKAQAVTSLAVADMIATALPDINAVGVMTRAMLKAYVLKLPFDITAVLKLDLKTVLHLTDEDALDRALYEAVQAQSQ